MELRDLVHRYYRAWLDNDRAACRALLDDAVVFTSPVTEIAGADAFLDECWPAAAHFEDLGWEHEVYDADRAMVSYRSTLADGPHRVVEYLEAAGGRLTRIVVLALQRVA